MSWYLESVYKRNKEAPYTFYIPSQEVIDILRIGDRVKLIFECETRADGYAGERMWVKITHRDMENFKGVLSNDPINISELKIGQEISFHADHICDTEYNDPKSSKWD